jgi:hypothetical protein
MKVTDLLGPEEAPPAAGASHETQDMPHAKAAGMQAAPSSGPAIAARIEPLPDGRAGAVGEDPRARSERGSLPERATRPRSTPLERRQRAEQVRAARRAARAARGAAVANEPSLEVRDAGGGSATRLATGEASRQAGAAVPAEHGTKTGEPEPAAPQPPPSDVAFDSGETGQYTTAQPVMVDDLGDIAGASGTLSFWLQPQWGEGSADDASFLELGDGRLKVVKNVNFLRFEWGDTPGTSGIGVPIAEWKAGEWHAVTTTWNGNTYALYVDGQLVSSKVDVGRVDLPRDTTLTIGSNYPESRPIAPGMIARVDVRNRPLAPGEIATAYKTIVGQ